MQKSMSKTTPITAEIMGNAEINRLIAKTTTVIRIAVVTKAREHPPPLLPPLLLCLVVDVKAW